MQIETLEVGHQQFAVGDVAAPETFDVLAQRADFAFVDLEERFDVGHHARQHLDLVVLVAPDVVSQAVEFPTALDAETREVGAQLG